MARGIVESIRNLDSAFDSLARRIRTTGVDAINELNESRNFQKVSRFVAVNDAFSAKMSMFNRAQDLIRAQNAMRRDPGRWKSPDEYLQHEADYKQSKKNFEYDMLDDYEQRIQDLSERYSGFDNPREKAEESLRESLLKEVGPFFRNSKISTKDLHGIFINLKKIGKIPLVGKLATALTNPIGLAVGSLVSAIGILSRYFTGQDMANQKAVDWAATRDIAGKPSNAFREAATKAGIAGPDIDTHWAKLMGVFGNPEAISAFANMPSGLAKMEIAKSFGLDGYDMRIADYLGNTRKQTALETLNTTARKADVIEQYGYMTGTDFATKYHSWRYKLPLIGGLVKAIDERLEPLIEENYKKGYTSKRKYEEVSISGRYKNIEKVINDTLSAAQSGIEYDTARPSTLDYIRNDASDKGISIHIDTAEFNDIKDYNDVKSKIANDATTVAERHEAAESYGPKMR